MFQKVLIRSLLLVISTACVAQAYIVPGEPAPLPAYDESNSQDNSGDISGPGQNHEGYQSNPSQSNPYEPNPYEPNPYQPGRPGRPGQPGRPQYGNREVKSVYIGRAVYNERLPLRELAGLDRNYNGAEVLSVRANTQPNSSSTTVVQLVADGRIVAQQINPGYQINLRPNMRLILGSNVRSLQLVVNGSTIINDLQIEILSGDGNNQPYPNPGPGPGPITPPPHNNPPGYGQQRLDINVNRTTFGNDQINLSQYVDLGRYNGMRITQVIVTASAQYQTAFVDLLINSFNQGHMQFSGGYMQQQSVWLQSQPIGQGADSIVLYTRGNMTVNRVTLVLSY